jgi:hypothetical protein
MTYVPDGAPFDLTFGADEIEPGLIAVGWLDADHEFPRGPVLPEFVERLKQLCRDGVNRTRGFHRCELCSTREDAGRRPPTVVRDAAGDFPVGGAEVRVDGPSGKRYAAPDMTIHYVEEHGYAPPTDFVDGVLHR